jgi:hypothetical protein
MKKLVTAMMLVAATSVAALAAAGPAAAATHRHQQPALEGSVEGSGYYDGAREMQIDNNDHASSPYAGGVG